MKAYSVLKLREHPEFAEQAAEWFHRKWQIPKQTYLESMAACIRQDAAWPQWYVVMDHGRILAGLGVISNDFHDRTDLSPNICAVYVEPAYRGQGIAGEMLHTALADLGSLGVQLVYLLTDHIGFYERYGWEFVCMAMGNGEKVPSRLYRHRTETDGDKCS